ncbi:hypothetical protein [Flavobacterium rhizosphaerae]|uniref:HTH cro/C1-type domain-containing protein n=1 Tax=Flavobacterium rhizosphaerae TaxID=3163298 RepID=A0ABW8YZ98_9FLAO
MSSGKRLEQYLNDKGNSNLKDFCREHDITYTSFIAILNGKRTFGMPLLIKIGELFPQLNINWLLFGRGPVEIAINNQEGLNDMDFQLAKYLNRDKETRNNVLEFLNKNKPEGQ